MNTFFSGDRTSWKRPCFGQLNKVIICDSWGRFISRSPELVTKDAKTAIYSYGGMTFEDLATLLLTGTVPNRNIFQEERFRQKEELSELKTQLWCKKLWCNTNMKKRSIDSAKEEKIEKKCKKDYKRITLRQIHKACPSIKTCFKRKERKLDRALHWLQKGVEMEKFWLVKKRDPTFTNKDRKAIIKNYRRECSKKGCRAFVYSKAKHPAKNINDTEDKRRLNKNNICSKCNKCCFFRFRGEIKIFCGINDLNKNVLFFL